VRHLLAALCGLPIVRRGGTVQRVLEHPLRKQVVTAGVVYDLPATSTVAVAKGDLLAAGELLSTDIDILDPSDPATDLSGISSVTVGRNLIGLPIKGTLSFRNEEVAPTFTAVDGHAVATFQIHGGAEDVELFWASALSRELSGQTSVARSLSLHRGEGEPGSAEMPATVNPLHYLLRTAIAGNLVLVRLTNAQLLRGAGYESVNLLRRLLPAHVGLLFLSDLTVDDAIYNQVEAEALSGDSTNEQSEASMTLG
jgi:hypothetical protein